MTKTCPCCGAVFETPYHHQKYCSRKCQLKGCKRNSSSEINKTAMQAKICGMTYGYYVAAIRGGKTFEELRPDDWEERFQKIKNDKPGFFDELTKSVRLLPR